MTRKIVAVAAVTAAPVGSVSFGLGAARKAQPVAKQRRASQRIAAGS